MSIKLSPSTIRILENYSSINPNLRVSPGHYLRSMSIKMTTYSEAKVEEEFTTPFAIYDLKEFLATLALFDTPVLTFDDKVVTIGDENDPNLKTFYYSADLSLINEVKHVDPTERLLSIAKFEFPAATLKRLQKASATMKLNDLRFEAKGGILNAEVYDKKGSNNNKFTVTLDNDWVGADFIVHVSIDKVNIVTGTYIANILHMSAKTDGQTQPVAMELTNKDQDLCYIISFDVD